MFRFVKIVISLTICFGFSHAVKIIINGGTKNGLGLSTAESTKIYGGRDTHIKEASYQAYFHGCSGAIISPTFILTAAHCLPGRRFWNYPFFVRVGSANRTTGGQWIQAKKFIPHPKFQIKEYILDLSYDVGIIELKSSINLNENASVIQIAKTEVPIGATALISGWGYTSPDELSVLSKYLQSINVTIIDRKECAKQTKDWGFDAPEITEAMICNSETGKESCKGDSGGPVVFNKTLVGIVSWGHPDCGVSPGVNVNVAHHEIQAFLKDNTDACQKVEDTETKNHLSLADQGRLAETRDVIQKSLAEKIQKSNKNDKLTRYK